MPEGVAYTHSPTTTSISSSSSNNNNNRQSVLRSPVKLARVVRRNTRRARRIPTLSSPHLPRTSRQCIYRARLLCAMYTMLHQIVVTKRKMMMTMLPRLGPDDRRSPFDHSPTPSRIHRHTYSTDIPPAPVYHKPTRALHSASVAVRRELTVAHPT